MSGIVDQTKACPRGVSTAKAPHKHIVYFGVDVSATWEKKVEQKDGAVMVMVANNVTVLSASGWHT